MDIKMVAILSASLLASIAAPAQAAGGYRCTTTDGSNIQLDAIISHSITSELVSVRLIVKGRQYSTVGNRPAILIGRSWIDGSEARVDLVDPDRQHFVAKLRALAPSKGGDTDKGILEYQGRKHPVDCGDE